MTTDPVFRSVRRAALAESYFSEAFKQVVLRETQPTPPQTQPLGLTPWGSRDVLYDKGHNRQPV